MVYQREYYLKLADGTILESSDCGYSDRKLHCWVKNKTLAEVFALFTDPEKTKEIRYCSRGTTLVYRGFTEIDLIGVMEDCIDVRLVGGTKGEYEDD